jgi:hypothetical protein
MVVPAGAPRQLSGATAEERLRRSDCGKRFETDWICGADKFSILHNPRRTRPVGIHFNAETIGVNKVDCLAVEMVPGTEFDSVLA